MPFCCSLVVLLLLMRKCNLVFIGLWRHMLLWKVRCCSLLEAHSFVWGRNDLFFCRGKNSLPNITGKSFINSMLILISWKKTMQLFPICQAQQIWNPNICLKSWVARFSKLRWPFMLYLVLYVSVIDSPSFSNYSIMTNNEALSFRKYTVPRPSIP